jgi:hypothetical protein
MQGKDPEKAARARRQALSRAIPAHVAALAFRGSWILHMHPENGGDTGLSPGAASTNLST